MAVYADNTFRKGVNKTQLLIDRLLSDRKIVKILEVGCGSYSHVCLNQDKYIVGIDISEQQLQRNLVLNEKIRGDIQDYNLPDSDFDLIICWWVLEHVSHPEKALINCKKALKDNGVIVIALPNIFSLKGMITKYTPHWFHVWIYRFVFGYKMAGIEGCPPFHTFLRFSIAPEAIKKFALENGLSIEYFTMYEDLQQKNIRKKYRILSAVWQSIKLITKALSFGKIDAEFTDYIIVLKKSSQNIILERIASLPARS
jgi:2-polyprenyl-3-methyl-5-hydroxy-6-metoxy-1,4-benzoquinol methylase